MPWCPVCKNEYVEGKTHCPDCDVDLVDELIEEPQEGEPVYLPTEEEIAEVKARVAVTEHMSTYTSARNRHSETRSSAWTFLAVGGIGFLIITLALIGLITLPFNIFSLAVMEIMFIIFLIIAGLSFRNALRMLDDISKEDDLEARVQAWAKENLSVSELTAGMEEDTPEEMRYFMVSESIREQLMKAFPEVDDAYAEELTENFYNELFS